MKYKNFPPDCDEKEYFRLKVKFAEGHWTLTHDDNYYYVQLDCEFDMSGNTFDSLERVKKFLKART